MTESFVAGDRGRCSGMKGSGILKKAKNQFVIYAMCSIFVLLSVLISVINVINFTMAGEDADQLTQMIEDGHGTMKKDKEMNAFDVKKKIGPMGPDSPEMKSSIRYFTVEFDTEKDYEAKMVEYQITAVTEEEAVDWARKLIRQKTGWTKTTYRYRVYKDKENNKVYVTIIDQGRELLGCYRILIISVCGEAVVLVLSFILLMIMGSKVFKPLEEADRKQKKFIANVESEFKMPLTIINANTEIMEKEGGSSDYLNSINKQVKKMFRLVKDFGSLGIVNEKKLALADINLSNLMKESLDYRNTDFEKKNLLLVHEIGEGVMVEGDEETIRKVMNELIDNALKFAVSEVSFTLQQKNGRTTILQSNDTKLASGSFDQVFDRFTRLDNAKGQEGPGLGLSYVKDVVKAHNGRISAKVNNGKFIIQIDW